MRHSFSPQEPVQLVLPGNNSPHTAGELYPTSNVTSFTPSILFADSVLLMWLLTRRWLGAYISLGSVGWLWHRNIASIHSPDSWSVKEYAGAEEALSGWNSAVCKGVGICGNVFGKHRGAGEKVQIDERPRVPDFVMNYAPYVYLYSHEVFLPGDIGEHLRHTIPYLNYSPITYFNSHQTLTNLNTLNQFGSNVYLTSEDDPSLSPEWLRGDRNKPIAAGNPDSGMSAAPGIIIWVPKPGGIIDAFYFYFYSFNLGNTVAGWRFGNHVGDWEHTAVRYIDGKPQAVFFSEHSAGAAYEYAAVEKIGRRPVSYSARGSHANYARPGVHYYAMPFHLLADVTDKGTLWDVTMNAYVYEWNMTVDVLTASAETSGAPTEWFHYGGKWGDRSYPLSDARQYSVAGQYHYVNGPTGPKSKNLDRKEICQNKGICVVHPSLTVELEGVHGGKWDDEDIPWPGENVGVEVKMRENITPDPK